jgi:hypothetical protein
MTSANTFVRNARKRLGLFLSLRYREEFARSRP